MLENKNFLLLTEFALDHKGIGIFCSFIMGKHLTIDFFFKRLRLLSGKWPYLRCHNQVSSELDTFWAYDSDKLTFLNIKGNILLLIICIVSIILLLGSLS
jgi:hypothetical protein